jgi:hypothetical protein
VDVIPICINNYNKLSTKLRLTRACSNKFNKLSSRLSHKLRLTCYNKKRCAESTVGTSSYIQPFKSNCHAHFSNLASSITSSVSTACSTNTNAGTYIVNKTFGIYI